MKRIGVFAGSFDPFTLGHLDIVQSACTVFDEVVIAVLQNIGKSPVFSLQERKNLILTAVQDAQLTGVRVDSFDGLLVEYASSIKASHIIRGLRSVKDFEYEMPIDAVNRKMAPQIHTVYFLSTPEYSAISSSIVREVGYFKGSLKGLVPEINENFIAERLAKR